MTRHANVHGARLQVRDNWHVLNTPVLVVSLSNSSGYGVSRYVSDPLATSTQYDDFLLLSQTGIDETTIFTSVQAATAAVADIYDVKPQRKLVTSWYDMLGYDVRVLVSRKGPVPHRWFVRGNSEWLSNADATIEQRSWRTRADAVAAVVAAHDRWMKQYNDRNQSSGNGALV